MARFHAITILVLLVAVAACSPAPTPPPTTSVTTEAAAAAYSAFLDAWTQEHGDEINAAAAAADDDPAQVAAYARTLVDAYGSFAEDLEAIPMPGSVRPAADREVAAVEVLVGLAGQLEATPDDASIRTQLQEAMARVARASAEIEALLGLSN